MYKAVLLALFLASMNQQIIANSWSAKLKQKVKGQIKTPSKAILTAQKETEKFVRLNGVYMDERRLQGAVSLPMRNNRFYLSAKEVTLYFGVQASGISFTNKANFILNTALLSKSTSGKTSLLSFLNSGNYRYPVKDVALLLGYNTVYNPQSRILKFYRYPEGKSPLLAEWKKVLKDQGLDDYVEKIVHVLKNKKTPTSSTPPTTTKPIPTFKYAFQDVYTTSFEAQTIASAGKRGDWYMRNEDIGAALPSRTALGKWIEVYYPKTGRRVQVEIIDVGPWNIDDPYWERKNRPAAEGGIDERGRRTNMAGLDLSYQTWVELGVDHEKAYRGIHSDSVHWDFIDR